MFEFAILILPCVMSAICDPTDEIDISEQWISYDALSAGSDVVARAAVNTNFVKWEIECLAIDFFDPSLIVTAVVLDQNCSELHIQEKEWKGSCEGWYRLRMLMSTGSCGELSMTCSMLDMLRTVHTSKLYFAKIVG
jgi:hypothetical protein